MKRGVLLHLHLPLLCFTVHRSLFTFVFPWRLPIFFCSFTMADELWGAIEEFNADEVQITFMIDHCISSTQGSTETAAAFASAAAPLLHAAREYSAPKALHTSLSNETHEVLKETTAVTQAAAVAAAACPPLGYAYTRAFFDAFALENDVDEISILEVLLRAQAF